MFDRLLNSTECSPIGVEYPTVERAAGDAIFRLSIAYNGTPGGASLLSYFSQRQHGSVATE
eukprot:scaffold8323_cov116-Isochrysis_galbana.AAC.6